LTNCGVNNHNEGHQGCGCEGRNRGKGSEGSTVVSADAQLLAYQTPRHQLRIVALQLRGKDSGHAVHPLQCLFTITVIANVVRRGPHMHLPTFPPFCVTCVCNGGATGATMIYRGQHVKRQLPCCELGQRQTVRRFESGCPLSMSKAPHRTITTPAN
jgi:hypothetical protein